MSDVKFAQLAEAWRISNYLTAKHWRARLLALIKSGRKWPHSHVVVLLKDDLPACAFATPSVSRDLIYRILGKAEEEGIKSPFEIMTSAMFNVSMAREILENMIFINFPLFCSLASNNAMEMMGDNNVKLILNWFPWPWDPKIVFEAVSGHEENLNGPDRIQLDLMRLCATSGEVAMAFGQGHFLGIAHGRKVNGAVLNLVGKFPLGDYSIALGGWPVFVEGTVQKLLRGARMVIVCTNEPPPEDLPDWLCKGEGGYWERIHNC